MGRKRCPKLDWIGFCQRHSPKMEQVRWKHPRNLIWNLKIMVSKRIFLFQGLFFRFHVKFRGCIFLLWVVMFGGQQPSKRKCHGNRSEKTYFTFAPTFHTKEVLRDTNSLWKFSTFSTMVFQPPKEFSKHWNDRNTKISSPLTHRTCGTRAKQKHPQLRWYLVDALGASTRRQDFKLHQTDYENGHFG